MNPLHALNRPCGRVPMFKVREVITIIIARYDLAVAAVRKES